MVRRAAVTSALRRDFTSPARLSRCRIAIVVVDNVEDVAVPVLVTKENNDATSAASRSDLARQSATSAACALWTRG